MSRILQKALLVTLVLLMVQNVSQTAFAQDKTIKVDARYYGKSLKNIFKDLAANYRLELDYPDDLFSNSIHTGTTFVNTSLDNCLKELLDPDLYHYKIVERRIIIRAIGAELNYDAPDKTAPGTFKDFTITGQVKDSKSGETLPYAQIIIDGTLNGTITNVDGYFTLFHVPIDTSGILVQYVGYDSKLIRLNPDMSFKGMVVELHPSTTQIGEVMITGRQEELMRISMRTNLVSIAPSKIAELPSIGEKDIFRTFQLLPGISGSQESSSGLFVRGGTPDQNLVLYDGFTVYHVDHLFGMFSAFNADAIKDVKLSKGGYESKYGGRLSSVMEITGKDGNEKGFDAGGNIGLISANAFMEIPLAGKGSILLSGRRSFQSSLYTEIFDQFQNNTATEATPMPTGRQMNRFTGESSPSSYFYDLNGKITLKPTSDDIISLSFYNGQDILDNSSDFNFSKGGMSMSGGRTDLTDWGNWGSSLKWSKHWSEKLYTNTLGSFSNYFSTRNMTSESSFMRSDNMGTRNTGIFENNDLYDYSIKQSTEWKTGKNNQVEFGFQGSYYLVDYLYTRNDTISIQDRTNDGFLTAAYLQDQLKLFDRLTITPGIRTSWYNKTNEVYWEPRFNTNLSITDKIKLKGSWGIFHQFTNRIIRDDLESGSRDFWLLADGETIPVGKSMHYIGGLSWENSDLLLGVDAFYKTLEGLTEYTLQYVPAYREINYDEFFYEGSGEVQGVEFLAQKKRGDFSGWLSYTYQTVEHQFDVYGPDPYPASHDVSHEFKSINTYKYRDWTFSAVWIYGTGKPYTAPLGAFELILPDGSTKDYVTVGDKNSFRLPDYHRLDLSAQYKMNLGGLGIGTLGISLFNVYNRKNVWYKQYEVIEGELLETDVTLLGFTPNISFSINLK